MAFGVTLCPSLIFFLKPMLVAGRSCYVIICGPGVLMPVLDTVWTGSMGRRMKIRSRRDAKVQGESGNENETAADK